jgi:hypothetical protein
VGEPGSLRDAILVGRNFLQPSGEGAECFSETGDLVLTAPDAIFGSRRRRCVSASAGTASDSVMSLFRDSGSAVGASSSCPGEKCRRRTRDSGRLRPHVSYWNGSLAGEAPETYVSGLYFMGVLLGFHPS